MQGDAWFDPSRMGLSIVARYLMPSRDIDPQARNGVAILGLRDGFGHDLASTELARPVPTPSRVSAKLPVD